MKSLCSGICIKTIICTLMSLLLSLLEPAISVFTVNNLIQLATTINQSFFSVKLMPGCCDKMQAGLLQICSQLTGLPPK